MTSPLLGKICDGGRICSAPKECCTLGCCYHPPPSNRMFNLLFLGHWYFWAVVTGCIVCLLCFCSLWKRCKALFCCFVSSSRDERASEPDSTGSCYVPPQYSRCNSFHHAPPPYNEVTSKPDLYPLVISYNGDTGMKRGGSASYLMVQYFRNYILRPSGSLSATSTLDSLNSSYICNAANTIVPPPYSCTGSLDGFSITNTTTTTTTTTDQMSQQQLKQQQQPCGGAMSTGSPSCHSLNTYYSIHDSSSSNNNNNNNNNNVSPIKQRQNVGGAAQKKPTATESHQNCDDVLQSLELTRKQIQQKRRLLITDSSIESETSQGDEHNFSELLNLSVCVPSSIINSSINGGLSHDFGAQQNLEQSYNSIANSITVSDISSLANLGTPDSPPRATSPTVEIRELLDKIQQLPQQKSPAPSTHESPQCKTARFFVKNKSKTLYMPLNAAIKTNKTFGSSIFGGNKTRRGWMSRSAPSTPCGTFTPLFPQRKPTATNQPPDDGRNALLMEHEGSDYEHNNTDECL